MYKFTVCTHPQAKDKWLRRLSPPFFMHAPPHMFCKIKLESPGVSTGEGLVLRGHSDTAAVWGPAEPKQNIIAEKRLRHRQTFSSGRWRCTWKGSICWSTLLEMIVSVNWFRHSAYQHRADPLYVVEIRSSYCYPIKTLLNTQYAVQPCMQYISVISYKYMKLQSNCIVVSEQ